MLERTTRIAIAGAGSIGCYVGGCLASAGRTVTLLARPGIVDAVRERRFSVVDPGAAGCGPLPASFSATIDPATALPGAELVLVTVKSGDTPGMAELIARHAPPNATIVSLQNSVGNAALLRRLLPAGQRVAAGMVAFNVVRSEASDRSEEFRRTTDGKIVVEAGIDGLVDILNVPGVPSAASDDMNAVLWGKLVLNLGNAINALSGLPLAEQLADRRWRLVLAAQIDEALAVMRACAIRPAAVGALRPALLPFVLRLPDFLFGLAARRMIALDPKAKSSTLQDLERGRRTETGEFQGAIVSLAGQAGIPAPLTRLVLDRIREAEAEGKGSPHLSPDQLSPA